MKKLFLLSVIATLVYANYTNCKFKNERYSNVCQKAVKSGVSIDYANRFLLSYFKTQFYDEVSWKYLQPSKIKYHREKEKQANNVLISYVPKMVENLQKYKKVYDKAEKKYGVNREIISAILLKETKLDKIKPTHDAFIVFNTILTRTKGETPREKWLLRMGQNNMVAIIKYCYQAKKKPYECNLPSSYAGAVGITQFMPASFNYAEAYEGDYADLTKMEDAIISVAKFLHVKASYDTLLDFSKLPDVAKVEQQWYDYEYKYDDASFVYEKSRSGKIYNCFTKNKPHLTYMKSYVKKIMRYNNSSNYAVGVLRLAYEAHKSIKKTQ
jgi:membrane-bound lytic murein transglycosylase B